MNAHYETKGKAGFETAFPTPKTAQKSDIHGLGGLCSEMFLIIFDFFLKFFCETIELYGHWVCSTAILNPFAVKQAFFSLFLVFVMSVFKENKVAEESHLFSE